MKNLTKVLAVVLALCLGLSMVGTAAFTDVAEDASYSEAVSILNALGILTGYEDGSFGPEKTITRAEFSAVVCRVLGLGEALGGTTMFSDVDGHWASGYIALVQQQGIVNGYPDGTFLPDNPVKYEEAIKMLVVALGYDPTIAKKDAAGNPIEYYPGAYIVVASQKGMTANLSNAKVGEEASRATVAQMVYNALTVPMMIQTGFGTNTTFGTGDQLLLNKINVTKFEGAVDQTSASKDSVKANECDIRVDNQITADIGNTSASSYVRVKPDSVNYDANPYIDVLSTGNTLTVSYDAELDETVKGLLDNAVVAYVKDADTDEPVLLAIAKRGTRNKEVSFMSEDVNDTKTDLGRSKICVYTDKDAEKYETYDIADIGDIKIYLNGREDLYDTDGNEINKATALSTYIDSEVAADIKLLCNTTSDEYNVVYITSYKDILVDSTNAKNYTVYGDSSNVVLDEEDDDLRFTIYKDGEVASFADIAENDVLSISGRIDPGTKELKYGTVIITSTQVSGKIDTFDDEDEKVTVDGKEYLYSGFTIGAGSGTNGSSPDVRIGDEATFYMNARGVLVGVDTEKTRTNLKYGFATVLGKSGGIGSTYKIVVFDTEGKEQTLDLNTKVDFNDEGSKTVSDVTLAGMKEYVGGTGTSSVVATEGTGDNPNIYVNKVIAYELNSSGKINKLYFKPVNGDDSKIFYYNTQGNATFNKDVSTFGNFDLTENTVIFSVDDENKLNTAEIDAEDLYIGTMSELVDRQQYNTTIYAYNADTNNVPAAIFGVGLIGAVDFSSNFFTVASKVVKENADGDLGVELTGYVAGEEATVFVADDADVFKMDYTDVDDSTRYDASDVADFVTDESVNNKVIGKGDILVMSKTAGGEAKKVYILASQADLYNDTTLVPDALAAQPTLIKFKSGSDEYDFIFGYAYEKDGSRLTMSDYEVKLSLSGAKGATFDINSAKGGKVSSAGYGDISPDKNANTGDYVFARVKGTKVEEFVNYTQYSNR